MNEPNQVNEPSKPKNDDSLRIAIAHADGDKPRQSISLMNPPVAIMACFVVAVFVATYTTLYFKGHLNPWIPLIGSSLTAGATATICAGIIWAKRLASNEKKKD